MKVPAFIKEANNGFDKGELVNIIGFVSITTKLGDHSTDVPHAVCVNNQMYNAVPLDMLTPYCEPKLVHTRHASIA